MALRLFIPLGESQGSAARWNLGGWHAQPCLTNTRNVNSRPSITARSAPVPRSQPAGG